MRKILSIVGVFVLLFYFCYPAGASFSPTPLELAEYNIIIVELCFFKQDIENSYMENLKKVPDFIETGNIHLAINQLKIFIEKVKKHIGQGKIAASDGNMVICMATDLIHLLNK